jgi:hydroxyacylglutathione hydrolase
MNRFTVIQRRKFKILAVPVLSDNLVYLLCLNDQAVLFDAGEAAPVLRVLREQGLELRHIFITHEHGDHVFGRSVLQALVERDDPDAVGLIEAIQTPGHTQNDVCFYMPEAGVVFTGDTLINGACGRVLGGEIKQLYSSMQRLAELPDDTLVFGGHDYLEENLEFALSLTPGNQAMKNRQERYLKNPAEALFAPMAEELRTNPFLQTDSFEAFRALRAMKDRF